MWCRYLHLRGGWAVPCIVSRTVRILHGDTKMVEFQAAYLNRSEIAYQRRHKPSLTDAEYSRLVKPYYVKYMHRIKMRPTCFSQQEVVCGALHGVEIRGRARRAPRSAAACSRATTVECSASSACCASSRCQRQVAGGRLMEWWLEEGGLDAVEQS